LQIEDVDLDECSAIVRKGKGAKGRRVHFSEATAALIDRYTRSRKQAGADARFGPLWVSVHGDRLGYNAIDQALRQRALQANVEGFHLHRLRHSMAVNWMARGGSQATGVFPVNESGWF